MPRNSTDGGGVRDERECNWVHSQKRRGLYSSDISPGTREWDVGWHLDSFTDALDGLPGFVERRLREYAHGGTGRPMLSQGDDPTEVVRTALENAASVAGLLPDCHSHVRPNERAWSQGLDSSSPGAVIPSVYRIR